MELVRAVSRPHGNLRNYNTDPQSRAPSTKDVSRAEFEDLLTAVEPLLLHDRVYSWDADINGVIVRYTGTSQHQYSFWQNNWWPAPRNMTPHATIWSVQGVPGADAHAYYCPALRQALFVNTEYYGQCKSWALGIAAAVLERQNVHSIHGATGLVAGHGIVIVAPTGTGKTTQTNRLFRHPLGKVVGDDWGYVHHGRDQLVVHQPERFLYVRTENALNEEWLRPIMERCFLENVVTHPDRCEHPEGEPCGFDLGMNHCLWGFGNSRAMLPREWLAGPERVADEAPLDLLVLLRRDPDAPAEVWLDPDEAVEVLREGRYQIRPGAGPREKWGTFGFEPWYNPYLLEADADAQVRFFKREVDRASCVLLNTGLKSETIERTHQRILQGLAKVTGDPRVHATGS